jgi:NAD(P)-dependent dehydrogenase (short-subunit alcohol dehydrogenase family)
MTDRPGLLAVRTAVVTGGRQGIGGAIALAFALRERTLSS